MTRYRLERHQAWAVLAEGEWIGDVAWCDCEGKPGFHASQNERDLGQHPTLFAARAAVVAAWEARGR